MNNIFSGRTCFPFQLLIGVLLALSSCDSFNVNKTKPSTNLEIGDETVVATQTIPSSGGIVTVDSPGSEIDGLEIMVPPQSYSTSKTFTISTTPITSHKLGEYFNPLTALIQIENGGDYSDSIMEITIPIILPDGDIPLGFYYDEITGKLEAIPVKEYTSTSITLFTRHFMPASEISPTDLKAGGIKIDPTANLVISSISESVLKGKTIISSGFTVGKDDWEFTNFGSYISSGGHCAGQTLAAMWYYFEKKLKGEGDLFGKFSTLASLWQDNAIGYRFCSVIQEDYQVDGEVFTFFDKYIDKNQELDKLKYYMIAGAMLVTGEPQGIAIFLQTGTNAKGKPIWDGHAVICYQVAINEGKLYISDPNKPGIEQFIEFKNNKFEPYIAKLNGNAASNPYPFVTWYAKTAYIDWPQIGKRYTELLDSTIGNKAPNIFPPYTIWVKGKVDTQLKDGFSSNSDTLRCMVECPTAEQNFLVNGKKLIPFDMYDIDGIKIDNWVTKIFGAYVILKPGLNKIGFYIYATKNGVTYTNGNLIDLFIDFKWFNITYSKLFIDPNPILGKPDEEIKITAKSGGTAPKNAKYVWNFGDNTKEVTVKNDSIVKHKFQKEDDYTVTVDLYDNSTNKLVGQATAEANILTTEMTLPSKIKFEVQVSGDVSFVNLKDNSEYTSRQDIGIGNVITDLKLDGNFIIGYADTIEYWPNYGFNIHKKDLIKIGINKSDITSLEVFDTTTYIYENSTATSITYCKTKNNPFEGAWVDKFDSYNFEEIWGHNFIVSPYTVSSDILNNVIVKYNYQKTTTGNYPSTETLVTTTPTAKSIDIVLFEW
jgi:hypothetical protein